MPASRSRLAAFSLFTVLVLLFSQAPANAATCIAAPPNGAGLQSCLDSTVAGDTILLPKGTYRPTNSVVFPSPQGKAFFIGKALTIVGEDREHVILSGNLGDARALNVVIIDTIFGPGMVTLDNLTIRDGDAAGGFFVGGGIVAADNQSVALIDTNVEDNHAALAGGGIWTGAGSTWTITGSTFNNNSSDNFGGAIAMFSLLSDSNNSWSIADSKFSGNSATNFGGAVDIFLVLGSATTNSYLITNSTFNDNHVDASGVRGGAVSASVARLAPIPVSGGIHDSTFKKNRGVNGGAVYVDGGNVTLSGNKFRHNEATASGGGLFMDFSFGNRLDDNEFKHNVAGRDGGAIYNRSIVVSMVDNETSHNCAGGFGGALYNTVDDNIPAGFTGIIELIDNNKLTHNKAQVSGGAIANVSATITELRQSEVTHNKAGQSNPGIYDPDGGIIVMTGVDVSKNKIGKVRCKDNGDDD